MKFNEMSCQVPMTQIVALRDLLVAQNRPLLEQLDSLNGVIMAAQQQERLDAQKEKEQSQDQTENNPVNSDS